MGLIMKGHIIERTGIFTLHAKSVCLWVCLWVCYHDNSKLHASIFTELGPSQKPCGTAALAATSLTFCANSLGSALHV